jgi:transcriptional regulator with XRE-family HTH domain
LRLRKLRVGLGLTVDDAAKKLECSPAKISRLETGARRPILRDVRDLCLLYNVDDSAAAELMQLTRQAREQGWWSQFADLNLEPYIGLETDASAITHYSMAYVPALLQTEDYARAVIKAVLPSITPEIHQHRVEARVRRQQRLDENNPPKYRALIDEAVLRRQLGGSAVMAAQLDKIMKLMEAGKAIVQVVPFDSAASTTESMFVFLEFSDPSLRPVVYVEGLGHNSYYERDADVAQYRETIDNIRDAALSPRDSLQVLASTREAYAVGGGSSA